MRKNANDNQSKRISLCRMPTKEVSKIFSLLIIFIFTTLSFAMNQFQKPNDAELRQKLTPMQYAVTQTQGTEPAFNNAYWNNEQPGIYVDIVSGEPLFSSLDKYDSKTGWPSFTKPISVTHVATRSDHSFLMDRTEVISVGAQSHLGHVFNDGPAPTYHRYCINSAALRFIPVDHLATEGYADYLPLFNHAK